MLEGMCGPIAPNKLRAMPMDKKLAVDLAKWKHVWSGPTTIIFELHVKTHMFRNG